MPLDNVVSLTAVKFESNVEEVLDIVKEEEFNSVIIFGFKEDMIHIFKSDTEDSLRVLGALERAKQALWEY
jgi:hypothetical protein